MHVNPDLLALLALGETTGSAEELAHLANCSLCQADRASFEAAVAIGRRTSDADLLLVPPPQVWARITEELRFGTPEQPEVVAADSTASPSPSTPLPAPFVQPTVGASRRSADQRSLRWASLALAAVLALVVGIGLGANLDSLLPGENAVASVQLNALPRWAGSSGEARVEKDRHGNRTLVVQISSPEPATGPREVWMTTSIARPMVAMGYLAGETGRFPIPPGMDLDTFRLIDISQEPANDHNPDHSGNSMLRGKLSA